MGSSAEGLKIEDIDHINKRKDPQISGSERSILEDFNSEPLPPKKETDAVATGSHVISDEEAGYDQDAYDAEVDSSDDADTPEHRAAFAKVYEIETKPIDTWSEEEIKLVEKTTGFDYAGLKESGVTEPDGLSIEDIMERGPNAE